MRKPNHIQRHTHTKAHKHTHTNTQLHVCTRAPNRSAITQSVLHFILLFPNLSVNPRQSSLAVKSDGSETPHSQGFRNMLLVSNEKLKFVMKDALAVRLNDGFQQNYILCLHACIICLHMNKNITL